MHANTVRVYLVLSFLHRFSFSFSMAMYVVYLQSRGGLNLFQVNMVNFTYFATMMALEIPTGAFADLFGRKISFVIGNFLRGLSFLIYGIAGSFGFFILAEAICAVGSTFESGAFKSWMVSRVRHFGYTGNNFSKVFSLANTLGNIAGIVSAYIGARVSDHNLSMPWFLASAGYLVLGIVSTIFMKEEYFERKKYSLKNAIKETVNMTRKGIAYARTNREVMFLFAWGLVFFVSVQAPNMQWQPFFKGFFSSNETLGRIMGGIKLCLLAGSVMAPLLLRFVKDQRKSLILLNLIIGVCIALSVMFGQVGLVIPIFLLHEIGRGMLDPILDSYLHDNIAKENVRATVSSFVSNSAHIGAMIGLLGSGMLANNGSIPLAWIGSGVFLVIGTIGVSVLVKKIWR